MQNLFTPVIKGYFLSFHVFFFFLSIAWLITDTSMQRFLFAQQNLAAEARPELIICVSKHTAAVCGEILLTNSEFS